MSASPTEARNDCATMLAGVGVKVANPVTLPLPRGTVVGLSPAGQTATEFLVRVSVYSSAANDAGQAVGDVETYSYAADMALTDLPRSDWSTVYDVELAAWVATTVVNVPREDF